MTEIQHIVPMGMAPRAASAGNQSRLRICLAGSGGGHVRQLLDIEPAWRDHDYFFVTEDTALGRSLAEDHPTHFVRHVALGQARLGAPIRMIWAAFVNLYASLLIAFRTRPQAIITTGAGAMFFTVLFGRLLGARIILIESFARFHKNSVFYRVMAPFAHYKIVQSQGLANENPDALVFDPIRVSDGPRPPKKNKMFVTVGATLPFDRLINSIAEAKEAGHIREEIVAQTGIGGTVPEGIDTVETMRFEEVQSILRDADIVVCHGGTGSLITALRQGCRVIAMPRLFELNEHYDNHQAQITEAFAERGLIAMANTTEELIQAIQAVREWPPVIATTEHTALIAHLNTVLTSVARRSSKPLIAFPRRETAA